MTDQQTTIADDEISLRDIVAALNRRKIIIFGCISATVLIGLLYAIFTQPLYTASVTVQPATGEEGGLSRVSSQLGGVASLAGIDLSGGGSERAEYLAILRSRELAERFIGRYDIKPQLFPDRWDPEQKDWKGGDGGGLGLFISRTLARLSDDEGWQPPQGPEPTDWEAYQKFSEIRSINEDTETGLVTLSFEFRAPELAAKWANDYMAMANEEIRQRTVEETSRALNYLNKRVEKTTISGLRETIFSLVEGQLEQIMMANAREEYAFRVLDPAVVPEERSYPKRFLIVVISAVLGFVLGIFGTFVLEARAERSNKQKM